MSYRGFFDKLKTGLRVPIRVMEVIGMRVSQVNAHVGSAHEHLKPKEGQTLLRITYEKEVYYYKSIKVEYADTYHVSFGRGVLESLRKWLRDLLNDELKKLKKLLKEMKKEIARSSAKIMAVAILEGSYKSVKGSKIVLPKVKETVLDVIDEMIEEIKGIKKFLESLKEMLREGFGAWEKEGHKGLEIYYEELGVSVERMEIEILA